MNLQLNVGEFVYGIKDKERFSGIISEIIISKYCSKNLFTIRFVVKDLQGNRYRIKYLLAQDRRFLSGTGYLFSSEKELYSFVFNTRENDSINLTNYRFFSSIIDSYDLSFVDEMVSNLSKFSDNLETLYMISITLTSDNKDVKVRYKKEKSAELKKLLSIESQMKVFGEVLYNGTEKTSFYTYADNLYRFTGEFFVCFIMNNILHMYSTIAGEFNMGILTCEEKDITEDVINSSNNLLIYPVQEDKPELRVSLGKYLSELSANPTFYDWYLIKKKNK